MNVLLIAIDGLRPKNLSCYGYSRNTSPVIDEFAENGILFENAFVNSAWTKPNIASILTGLNPSTHKVHSIEDKINEKIKTLPEILKEKGYKTAIFSGLRHPAKKYGFRGFDEHRIFEEVPVQFRTAEKINKEMIPWIKKNKKNNFFIYAHYIDTHVPFNPPEPFNTAFLKAPYMHKDPIGTKISEEELEKITALYDSEILYFDSELKKLIQEMKKMDLMKNTLLIITSDHGLNFMEHGYFCLLKFLYDESIRVPLIIYGLEKNKKIKQQVSLTDLMPTILEITGTEFKEKLDGQSLIPLIKNKSIKEKPILLENKENSHQPYCSGQEMNGIRTNEWKYIKTKQKFKFEIKPELFKKGSYWLNSIQYILKGIKNFFNLGFKTEYEELYNLKEDPNETKNIAKENKEKIRELKKYFKN